MCGCVLFSPMHEHEKDREQNTMCPLTGEYVGHMEKVCKTCKYPFCSRNTTVAPPQEQGDSDCSGSEVDRKVDSRHGRFFSERMKLISKELQFGIDKEQQHTVKEIKGAKGQGMSDPSPKTVQQTMTPVYDAGSFDGEAMPHISKVLQSGMGIDNKQHTVRPIHGLTSTGMSSKYEADEFGLFYGRILFHLKKEIDRMGLHLSLINTVHNENIIVISQNHSPIDGAYLMAREPKE